MALLQISEPGQSPNPHQRRIAVGIDLGTTHSLVAAVRNGVLPSVCRTSRAGLSCPASCAIWMPSAGRLAMTALAQQVSDAANTIASVKRLMGRGLADVLQADKLPYVLVDAPGMVKVQTVAGEKSPVEISAEILAALRYRAEDTFNDDLFGAVITVPAYFDDAQRQATKDAARLAGLNVLRLINEPTAAAIAYGLDNASEGIYAVYDLGGGTFDISILRLTAGVFEVIATGGDSALGGDDYDRALADWLLQTSGLAVASREDQARLLAAARQCKEALSSQESATVQIDLAGGQLQTSIRRTQFEEATAGLTASAPLQAVQASLARCRPGQGRDAGRGHGGWLHPHAADSPGGRGPSLVRNRWST